MKRWLLIFVLLLSIFACAVSCSEKKVDKRAQAIQLVKKGEFRKAKNILIALRSNFPNDKTLIELERQCNENIAAGKYKNIWKKAEEKNTYKGWIRALKKIQAIENYDKKMKLSWKNKAVKRAVESGAKSFNDGQLLGMLEKLTIHYKVISHEERLKYITKFFKDGRFPLKEWKDTFVTTFPELLDDDGNFVGWPKPKKEEKKEDEKQKKG